MEAVQFVPLKGVPWCKHNYMLNPMGYIQPAKAEENDCRQFGKKDYYYRDLT